MVTSVDSHNHVNIKELKKYLFHRMFPELISYCESDVQEEQLMIKVGVYGYMCIWGYMGYIGVYRVYVCIRYLYVCMGEGVVVVLGCICISCHTPNITVCICQLSAIYNRYTIYTIYTRYYIHYIHTLNTLYANYIHTHYRIIWHTLSSRPDWTRRN